MLCDCRQLGEGGWLCGHLWDNLLTVSPRPGLLRGVSSSAWRQLMGRLELLDDQCLGLQGQVQEIPLPQGLHDLSGGQYCVTQSRHLSQRVYPVLYAYQAFSSVGTYISSDRRHVQCTLSSCCAAHWRLFQCSPGVRCPEMERSCLLPVGMQSPQVDEVQVVMGSFRGGVSVGNFGRHVHHVLIPATQHKRPEIAGCGRILLVAAYWGTLSDWCKSPDGRWVLLSGCGYRRCNQQHLGILSCLGKPGQSLVVLGE